MKQNENILMSTNDQSSFVHKFQLTNARPNKRPIHHLAIDSRCFKVFLKTNEDHRSYGGIMINELWNVRHLQGT